MWVKVIRSLYGRDGGLGLGSMEGTAVGTTWGGILKVGRELEDMGIEWSNMFQKRIGNGESTLFWKDRWVGNITLENRFPRLYRLERNKDCRVSERWGGGADWRWDWRAHPRGRTLNELGNLSLAIQNVSLSADKIDTWCWKIDNFEEFSVHVLRRLIEDKRLDVNPSIPVQQMIWNPLIPRKVCLFIWRALKDRIPVRSLLDRRGIDLHSTLCPSCGLEMESLVHCLVTCPVAISAWEDIYDWWGLSRFTGGSVTDVLLHPGHSSISFQAFQVWQAVSWVTAYLLWKARNDKVFKNKASSGRVISLLVKICAYNWIAHRSKHGSIDWMMWLEDPMAAVG